MGQGWLGQRSLGFVGSGPIGAGLQGGVSHWRSGQLFAPSLASVPDCRHFVQAVLAERGVDQLLVELAALAVSELAANAVVHAGTFFDVVVDVAECVRITVTDGCPHPPVIAHTEEMSEHGRGIRLVDAIGDRWGVDQAGGGKQVWWEHDLWPPHTDEVP